MASAKPNVGVQDEAMTNPPNKEEQLRVEAVALARQLIAVAANKERNLVFIAVGVLLGQIEKRTGGLNRDEMLDLIISAMNDQHTALH